MTDEEAVKVLRTILDDMYELYDDEVSAINIAIDALRERIGHE